jgi:hypothetical protein
MPEQLKQGFSATLFARKKDIDRGLKDIKEDIVRPIRRSEFIAEQIADLFRVADLALDTTRDKAMGETPDLKVIMDTYGREVLLRVERQLLQELGEITLKQSRKQKEYIENEENAKKDLDKYFEEYVAIARAEMEAAGIPYVGPENYDAKRWTKKAVSKGK